MRTADDKLSRFFEKIKKVVEINSERTLLLEFRISVLQDLIM